jgi:hypothetical protein
VRVCVNTITVGFTHFTFDSHSSFVRVFRIKRVRREMERVRRERVRVRRERERR